MRVAEQRHARRAAEADTPVIVKVERAVVHGAKTAASGVERGVKAAASGVARGARAAAGGIEKGAQTTARVVNKVAGPSGAALAPHGRP